MTSLGEGGESPDSVCVFRASRVVGLDTVPAEHAPAQQQVRAGQDSPQRQPADDNCSHMCECCVSIAQIAVVAGALIHYRAVMLLLEWRNASGGCAVPVTAGHVPGVLQQMRELGHALFGIDEVWHKLRAFVHDHHFGVGGGGGGGAAGTGEL